MRQEFWLRLLNALAQDRIIRHQVWVEALKTHQVHQMTSVLAQEVLPKAKALLDERLDKVKRGRALSATETQRRMRLIEQIEDVMMSGARTMARRQLSDMLDVAETEAEWVQRLYGGGMTRAVTVDLERPSIATLRTLVGVEPFNGRNLTDWWDSMGQSTARAMQQTVTQGLVEGLSTQEITRRARLVSADLARRHVETITRTATQHVTNETRARTFRENKGVVVAWRFVATLDSRTSDICRKHDGMLFDVGEGPQPPLHPNCRSTMVPVTRSLSSFKLRDDVDPPDMPRASARKRVDYNAWLKDQPEDVQNEALGKGKADLFRRGRLHIRHFADAQGRPRTLDELRRLEGMPARERGGGRHPRALRASEVRRLRQSAR